jgi:2-octaprenyl-6-methoxyphenol hydroxylase
LIDAKKAGADLGADAVLHAYESRRRADNMAMAGVTDILNKLFSNDSKSLRALRIVGLKMVQKIGPARRFFMKQAMGEGGQISPLHKIKK